MLIQVRWDEWVRDAFRFEYMWIEDKPDVNRVLLKSRLHGRENVKRVDVTAGDSVRV